MKKFKLILYLVLLAYVIGTVLLLSQTDAWFEWLGESLPGVLNTWQVVGIILLIIELATENIHIQQLKHDKNHLEKEMLTLKAKLYDHEITRTDKEVNVLTNPSEEETSAPIEDEFNKEEEEGV